MKSFFELFIMYWYMIWYPILKKYPYWLKIFIEIMVFGIIVYILYKLIISIIPPIINALIIGTIYIIQFIIFIFHDYLFKQNDFFAILDESINNIGVAWNSRYMRIKNKNHKVKNNEKQNQNKTNKKHTKFKIYVMINVFAFIVIIVPYYLCEKVDGYSKELCLSINTTVETIEKNIFKDIDKYIAISEEVSNEPIMGIENEGQVESITDVDKIEANDKDSLNNIVIGLSKKGKLGANIRSKPSTKSNSKILDTLSGSDTMIYKGNFKVVEGVTWINIETNRVKDAWISSNLINKKDLKKLGID